MIIKSLKGSTLSINFKTTHRSKKTLKWQLQNTCNWKTNKTYQNVWEAAEAEYIKIITTFHIYVGKEERMKHFKKLQVEESSHFLCLSLILPLGW